MQFIGWKTKTYGVVRGFTSVAVEGGAGGAYAGDVTAKHGGTYIQPREHEAHILRDGLKIIGRMTPQYS